MHPNIQKASIFLHSTLKDTLFTHASDGCFTTVCLRVFHPLGTRISEEKDSMDAGETWHHPEAAAQEDMQTLSKKKSKNSRLPRCLLSSEFWLLPGVSKGLRRNAASDESRPRVWRGLGWGQCKMSPMWGWVENQGKVITFKMWSIEAERRQWPNQVFNWREVKRSLSGLKHFKEKVHLPRIWRKKLPKVLTP